LSIPFKIGQPKKQIVPKTVSKAIPQQTKKLQKDMKKSTDADLDPQPWSCRRGDVSV
uniref:Uncharacterized protein n=1 Tax=Meleagris gallopavo TaxID=9103 RepID=A0A803YN07_MELGA